MISLANHHLGMKEESKIPFMIYYQCDENSVNLTCTCPLSRRLSFDWSNVQVHCFHLRGSACFPRFPSFPSRPGHPGGPTAPLDPGIPGVPGVPGDPGVPGYQLVLVSKVEMSGTNLPFM